MPVFVYNIQKDPSKCRLHKKCVAVDFSLNITYTTKTEAIFRLLILFYLQKFTTFLGLKHSTLSWSIFENEKFKNVSNFNCSGLICRFKNSWISSSITRVLWAWALFAGSHLQWHFMKIKILLGAMTFMFSLSSQGLF